MNEILTISKIIERISSGDIRIPAFQRDFVWEADQVAFLLDSIYKEFPIGTIILWKTDKRLASDKQLGHFILPEPKKDYPVNYVLDGQQRLTSIFSVFQTTLKPTTEEWIDIYFDLEAPENISESSFIALEATEVDARRHFLVKTFFDSIEYRKATKELSDDQATKIDSVQRKFLEYLLPNIVFETDDMNRVAIVFERINRSGTKLDTFQLLTAWSWSESFDLVDKFEALQEKITEHGYEELCNDRELQLKIMAGIIKGSTLPSTIIGMKGEEIRINFTKVENGIIGAIDYLKRELKITHYKILPYPAMLVPLCCFFATERADGHNHSSKQKDIINKWFWRSVFSRRFSSDVNEKQSHDIVQMLALRSNENHDFKFPTNVIKMDFMKTPFSPGSANSKTFISMLNQLDPHSLLSGSRIDLAKVLKKGSKHEYHHIFPKNYLSSNGFLVREINVLGNICFLTRSDNNSIKDKSPNSYNSQINPSNRTQYLESALIPSDFEAIDYKTFLNKRKVLLEDAAMKLMGG